MKKVFIVTTLAVGILGTSIFVFAKQVSTILKKPTTTAVAVPKATTSKPVVKKPVPPKKIIKQVAPPKKVTLPKRLPVVVEAIPTKNQTGIVPVVSENSEPFTTSDGTESKSPLTIQGVLNWTNQARQDNGSVPAVSGSARLNAIAAVRLKDMFDNQYFAHVSPAGVSPSEIAIKSGYDFITFGENIARGTYADDQALVDAWMHSPHHRENILNPHYHELGIAVGKGMYEGHETWIAVQDFGTPASACPEPDATIKAKIDSLSTQITQGQTQADTLHAELQTTTPKTKTEIDAYNIKVGEYNALVAKLNGLSTQLKTLVQTYNDQAEARNTCIEK